MPNKKFFLPIVALFSVAALASCGPSEPARDPEIEKVYNAYRANAEGKGESVLSYEEWLASIKGEQGPKGDKGDKGDQGEQGPAGADGEDGAPGKDGEDGAPGKDGEDGAPGKDGEDGDPGKDGEEGEDGLSAYQLWAIEEARKQGDDPEDHSMEEYIQFMTGKDGKSAYAAYKEAHPDYTGSEAQWISDLCNGRLADVEEKKYEVLYFTNYKYEYAHFNDDLPEDAHAEFTKVSGASDLSVGEGFSVEVKEGGYAPKPLDPSIEGFEFVGWYVEGKIDQGEGATDIKYFYEPFNFLSAPIYGQTILRAKYEAKKYHVHIVVDAEESYDLEIPYGAKPLDYLPAEVAAKHDGLLFEGLYVDPSFSEQSKVDLNAPYTYGRDYEVYAKYVGFDSVAPGDYFYENGSYLLKMNVSASKITVLNVGTASFAQTAMDFELDSIDAFGYFVFKANNAADDWIIVKPSVGEFKFVETYHYNSYEHYVRLGDSWARSGEFYGEKYDREGSFGVANAYVANQNFSTNKTVFDVMEGDQILIVGNYDDNASIKKMKKEILTGSDLLRESYTGALFAQDGASGTATVKVSDYDGHDVVVTINITAKKYVESISVTGEGVVDNAVTLKVGDTLQLSYSYLPEDANAKDFRWLATSTSGYPTDVITVSETGLVTAAKPGTAYAEIYEDQSGKYVDIVVTVEALPFDIPTELVGEFHFETHNWYDDDKKPIDFIITVNDDKTASLYFNDTMYGEPSEFAGTVVSYSNGILTIDGDLMAEIELSGNKVYLNTIEDAWQDFDWYNGVYAPELPYLLKEIEAPEPAFSWNTFVGTFKVNVEYYFTKVTFKFVQEASDRVVYINYGFGGDVEMSYDFEGCNANQIHIFGVDEGMECNFDVIVTSDDGETFTLIDNCSDLPEPGPAEFPWADVNGEEYSTTIDCCDITLEFGDEDVTYEGESVDFEIVEGSKIHISFEDWTTHFKSFDLVLEWNGESFDAISETSGDLF